MEYPTDDFGRWVLPTATGIDSLEYVQTPLTFSLGPHDVLVRMQAVSLNPRDLAIINVSTPRISFHDARIFIDQFQGIGKVHMGYYNSSSSPLIPLIGSGSNASQSRTDSRL